MRSVRVFSLIANGGHRAEYNAVLEKELSALGVTPTFVDRITTSIVGSDIIFAMIEEAPASFALCALASVALRNTVIGLLFRPRECFCHDRAKNVAKYLLFRLLRQIKTVRVLSILPFSVDPRFAEVAHDWIYDPQLWDSRIFDHLTDHASTALSLEVTRLANGRILVVALGGQGRTKGFDYFSEIWCASAEVRRRYFFVAAGEVERMSRSNADRLDDSGGLTIDRFISDQEMNALYRAADLIWAAYAPNYDQASGVAGRAFQFGATVLLRRGSYMAELMGALCHPSIELDWEMVENAAETLSRLPTRPMRAPTPTSTLKAMHAHFVATLGLNVGASTPEAS